MTEEAKSVSVIVLIHGIRTRAFWYDTVIPILETVDGIHVRPINYGRFDVFSFLLPGPTRHRPEAVIRNKIKAIISDFGRQGLKPSISVIAHSFGTYAIKEILETDDELVLSNLILCGSVVPSSYDFENVRSKVQKAIINDTGFRDLWPVTARLASFGYGDSGTYGFGCARCHDRHHNLAHSEFFSFSFVHKYWLSVFRSDEIVPSEFNRSSRREPLIQRLLSLHLHMCCR
jgi:pimeloyl-ACP methyl ester carboxylesterase